MNAFLAHDAAGEAAEYAPDGVEYRPRMAPIVGPAALQAFDTKFFADHPSFSASWTTRSVHIAASGDLAISIEDVEVHGLGATGDASDKAIGITVWKKVNGQWKIAHAMGSSIVPDTAPSSE
jgi:ketosteroid isomerase-like protein